MQARGLPGSRSPFSCYPSRKELYPEHSAYSMLDIMHTAHHMDVAQSGRATVSKTVGWGFDSLRPCHPHISEQRRLTQ